jgi:hypothetical protein
MVLSRKGLQSVAKMRGACGQMEAPIEGLRPKGQRFRYRFELDSLLLWLWKLLSSKLCPTFVEVPNMAPGKQSALHNLKRKGLSLLWVKGVNASSGAYDETALRIFQADTLIPEQFLATHRRKFYLNPERSLMLAVLQDAIFCFQANLMATSRKKRVLFLETEQWILEQDKVYAYSFENICQMLGVEASYLRKGIMRWKHAALNTNTAAKLAS